VLTASSVLLICVEKNGGDGKVDGVNVAEVTVKPVILAALNFGSLVF